MSEETTLPMTAVVLAGDRGGEDPLALAAGVPSKALTPVQGRPMVTLVLDSLLASERVGRILLCGPAREHLEGCAALRAVLRAGRVEWVAPADSPCRSLSRALEKVPLEERVLVTTADHALLDEGIIDHFVSHAQEASVDLAVAVARKETVLAAFPEARRTGFKLRDGVFCGCNLFAFLSGRARRAVAFWNRVEALRKHPLRIAGILGWPILIGYLLRLYSLEGALKRLSGRMGLSAKAVIMPIAAAAVDVDSVGDYQLAQAVLARSRG